MADYKENPEKDALAQQVAEEEAQEYRQKQNEEAKNAGSTNVMGNTLTRFGLGIGGFFAGSFASRLLFKGDGFFSKFGRFGVGMLSVVGVETFAEPLTRNLANILPESPAKDVMLYAANTLGSYDPNENAELKNVADEFLQQGQHQTEVEQAQQAQQAQQEADDAEMTKLIAQDIDFVEGTGIYTGDIHTGKDFVASSVSITNLSELSKDDFIDVMHNRGEALIKQNALENCMEHNYDYASAALASMSGTCQIMEEQFDIIEQSEDGVSDNLKTVLNEYAVQISGGVKAYSDSAQVHIENRYPRGHEGLHDMMQALQNINQSNTTASMESLAYLDAKYHFMTEETKEILDNCSIPGVPSMGKYFDTFKTDYEKQIQAGADPMRDPQWMEDVSNYTDVDNYNYFGDNSYGRYEGQMNALEEQEAQVQANKNLKLAEMEYNARVEDAIHQNRVEGADKLSVNQKSENISSEKDSDGMEF